mgnify:CR=1 FL=1
MKYIHTIIVPYQDVDASVFDGKLLAQYSR